MARTIGEPRMLTISLFGFDGYSGRYPALDVWMPEEVSITARIGRG